MTHHSADIAWHPAQLAANNILFHLVSHIGALASHIGAYVLAALMLAAAAARALGQARHRHWPAAVAWLAVGVAAAALTFTAYTVSPDHPQPTTPAIDSSQSS